jgi:hypothetical protein
VADDPLPEVAEPGAVADAQRLVGEPDEDQGVVALQRPHRLLAHRRHPACAPSPPMPQTPTG